MPDSKVYLIPCFLDETAIHTVPVYITESVKHCHSFFVENERTARRYLKQLWKNVLPGEELVIDNYKWFSIHKAEGEVQQQFKEQLNQGKNIGIISEAGCPGIADPGQVLVKTAQEMGVTVNPLVGPSSIVLALMASGMNGQLFQFNGYLPIDNQQRAKAVKELESISEEQHCTQIFIETPYRNNQLIDTLLKTCKPGTRLCIGVNITGENEWIKTKTIAEWAGSKPDIHKQPAIFLLLAR
jgi:16S rRNA (cytidine1402-2'-O)-methyltransferase